MSARVRCSVKILRAFCRSSTSFNRYLIVFASFKCSRDFLTLRARSLPMCVSNVSPCSMPGIEFTNPSTKNWSYLSASSLGISRLNDLALSLVGPTVLLCRLNSFHADWSGAATPG